MIKLKVFDPFENFVDEFFGGYPVRKTVFEKNTLGSVNVKETDEDYQIEVLVPGFDKSDIKIKIDKDVLKISGSVETKDEEEKENYNRIEFSNCSFERSFAMPEDATEEVDAIMENGILKLKLNKKEKVVIEPKEIEIK